MTVAPAPSAPAIALPWLEFARAHGWRGQPAEPAGTLGGPNRARCVLLRRGDDEIRVWYLSASGDIVCATRWTAGTPHDRAHLSDGPEVSLASLHAVVRDWFPSPPSPRSA